MPAKVMVHPEKRKEKDKTDRKAILERRARKRLYAYIASLLSSVENDITVMIMDPDAVVVKDLTTTTQYIKYRFDPGLLMRWDEKYPEFAEILNRKAYISYNGYLCLFCTDCFDLLNDGTLLFKEEFVKAHFRDYCVTALYNENYDILDPESIPYNIPGPIVAKTRKLTKFSPAEKEKSKELNYIEIPTTDAGIFSGPGGPGGGDDPFSIKLREYMKGPPRIIIEELSARTGIPRRTIERLRTYKYKYLDGVVFPNHDPIELKHVIACIVGLHLTYPKAVKLIALAGYMLNEETPEGRAYEKIIKYYNKFSVPACNDYLVRNHLPPLTNNADVLSPHDDLTQ